jgi:hypothetical protein
MMNAFKVKACLLLSNMDRHCIWQAPRYYSPKILKTRSSSSSVGPCAFVRSSHLESMYSAQALEFPVHSTYPLAGALILTQLWGYMASALQNIMKS